MGLRPQLDFLSPSPEAHSSFLSRLVLIFPSETWKPFLAYGFFRTELSLLGRKVLTKPKRQVACSSSAGSETWLLCVTQGSSSFSVVRRRAKPPGPRLA